MPLQAARARSLRPETEPPSSISLYVRPLALLHGEAATSMVAAGKARALAGGPLAFPTCEIILRTPTETRRVIATLAEAEAWRQDAGAELSERLFYPFVGDAERAQGGWMRRNTVLADFPADRDHLGDTRNAQETRPDNEVRGLAKLHRRRALAGDSDEKNLSHDGADRTHLRHGERRELIADQSEPFGNLLAVAVDVGAPLELDIDHGQADAGH